MSSGYVNGLAFDASGILSAGLQAGIRPLQRKKSLCYDAFALTDHGHPRGTLGLRAAAPAIKIEYLKIN
jgi:hypothetical protein